CYSSGARSKAMSVVAGSHIRLAEQGVAWIRGTNKKVIQVVLDKLAHGWSPEEIHFQHPHLSLAQIHAALTYYYDHQKEMDAEIEQEWREADELRKRHTPSLAEKRLRKASLVS